MLIKSLRWRYLAMAGLFSTASCGGGDLSTDEQKGTAGLTQAGVPSGTPSPTGDSTTSLPSGNIDLATNTPEPAIADLRVDLNRDGVVSLTDTTDDADEETWDASHGAIFLANIDLDDANRCQYSASQGDDVLASCNDASDNVVNGSDDLLDMAEMQVLPWPQASDGAEGKIGLSQGATKYVRLFKKSGGGYAVFDPVDDVLTVDDLRLGAEFRIEGRDVVRDSQRWDGFVDVTLRVTAPSRADLQSIDSLDKVRLRVAPLLTFHHLNRAEDTFVSRVPSIQWGAALSTTFVNSLKSLVSSRDANPLTEVPTEDIWNQDYFETAYMSMPKIGGEQHVIRVNIRSANIYQPESRSKPLRTAGRVVFMLQGKDSAALTQYDRSTPNDMQTLNSTGNTETVPPYTLNGVSYPLGRILQGNVPSYYIDKSFTRMLESQKVQSPIYVDTSWLAVGHVDESISFVQANNARGWVILVADPRLALQMLTDAKNQGFGNTKIFAGLTKSNWQTDQEISAETTISALLADQDVLSDSTMAAAEIDAQVDILRTQMGLTEADIIRVPVVEEPTGFGSIALSPNTVNGFYLDTNAFISAEPHGPIINGKDIFKEQLEKELRKIGVTVRWLEDWDLYHVNMGDVHCATNTTRAIPSAKWWESGR